MCLMGQQDGSHEGSCWWAYDRQKLLAASIMPAAGASGATKVIE
jgi:hypothetical protein